MTEQFANNAQSTTTGAINGSSDPVTFSVQAGDGAKFPSSGDFRVIIDGEILLVTSRSTDSLTASRAQEGTSIAAHSSGATVTHVLTAASIKKLIETSTIWDAANDYVRGSGADTAVRQAASAATPAAVATAAAVGTPSNPPSADDHAHLWTGSTFAGVALSGVPKLVRKTSDETVNSAGTGSTLQNDDELLWAVAANEVWFFQAWLLINAANNAMDFKAGWSVPSGTTMQWGTPGFRGGTIPGFAPEVITTTQVAILTESGTLSNATAAVTNGLALAGMVVASSTPGNVNLQWAQNTSDAGNLKVLTNSILLLWRLA